MANCRQCGQDAGSGASCSYISVYHGDDLYARVVYGQETVAAAAAANCPGCGVVAGGVHHRGIAHPKNGCAYEQCPVCGRALFWSAGAALPCECGLYRYTTQPADLEPLPPGVVLTCGIAPAV